MMAHQSLVVLLVAALATGTHGQDCSAVTFANGLIAGTNSWPPCVSGAGLASGASCSLSCDPAASYAPVTMSLVCPRGSSVGASPTGVYECPTVVNPPLSQRSQLVPLSLEFPSVTIGGTFFKS